MSRQIAIRDITVTLDYLPYDGDANPLGFLTQSALAGYATTSSVTALLGQLVGAAPATLDTLAEIAATLQSDEAGVASLTALVATKQDAAQVAAAIAAGTAATISGVLPLARGGTGATTADGARAALQLGDAATRPVGTGAGTLAAGDDPRILAAQTAPQVSAAIVGGLAPYSTAASTTAQIAAAIAAGTAANVSGVVDLAHGGTGATNAGGARASLGLGPGATAPFGATPGTLAAGDDARFARAAQRSANLADLADPAAARANLGLTAAATAAIGTGAGTLAAGDDPRILAAQTAQQVGGAIAAGLAGYATSSSVEARIADLIGAAPAALDTLAELAAQLQADESGVAALSGVVATKQTASQVASAIAAGTAANVSGVVDLAHGGTGATNAGGARTNLGLGGAARADVGSTPGTVAAGDDARLTGAAQKAANLGDLADLVAARNTLGAQAALGFTPIQQGGGAGQSGNKIRIGWSGSALKAQVDGVDLGNVALESWATGAFARSQNAALTGPARLTDPSTTSTAQFTINGAASSEGSNLRLEGNGGATPSKTMRAHGGRMEWVNDAYNAVLMTLDDVGGLTTNRLATGVATASTLGVQGRPSGAAAWGTNQGLWQGWNLAEGHGKSDLINSRGGGSGGFDFWNVATDAAAAPVLLLDIDQTGRLATTGDVSVANGQGTVTARNAALSAILTDDAARGLTIHQNTLLGGTTGSTVDVLRLESLDANVGLLRLYDYRVADGGQWTTAPRRLSMQVDASPMGFIEWNAPNNLGGVSFGTGGVPGSGYALHVAANGDTIVSGRLWAAGVLADHATVTRSLSARFSDHLTVWDFAPPGTTDFTAALQAGLDYLAGSGGGELWLTRGDFVISAPLEIRANGVKLRGVGRGAFHDVPPLNPGASRLLWNGPTDTASAMIRVRPRSVTPTAAAAVSNATVVPVSSTAGIVAGMAMTGGSAYGALVTAVGAGSVTLNQAATIANGAGLVFGYGKLTDVAVLDLSLIGTPGYVSGPACAYGLLVFSTQHSEFDLHTAEFTVAAVAMSCVPQPEAANCEGNTLSLRFRQINKAGTALQLGGTSTGNTCFCRFPMVYGYINGGGIGIDLQDCDNNIFDNVWLDTGASARPANYTVVFRAQTNAAGPFPSGGARANTFEHLSTSVHQNWVYSEGLDDHPYQGALTVVTPAYGNRINYFDNSNVGFGHVEGRGANLYWGGNLNPTGMQDQRLGQYNGFIQLGNGLVLFWGASVAETEVKVDAAAGQTSIACASYFLNVGAYVEAVPGIPYGAKIISIGDGTYVTLDQAITRPLARGTLIAFNVPLGAGSTSTFPTAFGCKTLNSVVANAYGGAGSPSTVGAGGCLNFRPVDYSQPHGPWCFDLYASITAPFRWWGVAQA